MLEAFLHGFVLAFGLILPLGVQNVFVFNQGATQPSFWRAIPVILTASICDTLLILMAVWGVSLLILTFAWLKVGLFLAGFCFLLYLGWVTWKSPSCSVQDQRGSLSAKKQIVFAASVSLLNPHAIMDTIGVIGTSSLGYTGEEKWMFTFTCILVSWIWFVSLALLGRCVGKLDSQGYWMRWQNKISAVIIWVSAVYIILLSF